MALDVHIVTPTSEAFSGDADAITVPGWEGEFQVLPGHDILLSLLRGGLATVVSGGQPQKFVVGRGFVEAGPDRVTLLTDSCTPGTEVDKSTVDERIKRAEEAVAAAPAGTPEGDRAAEQLEIARAEQRV